MKGKALFRPLNVIFAVFAFVGALGIIVGASTWRLSYFEEVLYVAVFLSFISAFILFSRAYSLSWHVRTSRQALWFRISNGVVLLMFLGFLGFMFQQLSSDDRVMLDPKITYARIYRVDPEGYRKNRKIYYTFEVQGERYIGIYPQPDPIHRIGDSVRVVFSQAQPDDNRILK